MTSDIVVAFDTPKHPLQWLVALYQLMHGYKYWKLVHTYIFLYDSTLKQWVRVELGWDGLSLEVYDDEMIPGTYYVSLKDGFNVYQFKRLGFVQSLGNVLGDKFRYCPWATIPMLTGNPAWLNCASLVSYILMGSTDLHTPAELARLLYE